jgi:hypothetical protein
MKTQFCSFCGKDTLHNPLKKTPKGEQFYRCVVCGNPRRYNGKNFAIALAPGSRAVNLPYPIPPKGALGAS